MMRAEKIRWWFVAMLVLSLPLVAGCPGGGFYEPQSCVRVNPLTGTYTLTTTQEQSLVTKGVRAWRNHPEKGDGVEIDELTFANESAQLLMAMVSTMEAYRTQMEEFQGIQDRVNQGILGTLTGLQGMVTALGQAVPGFNVNVDTPYGGGSVGVTPDRATNTDGDGT